MNFITTVPKDLYLTIYTSNIVLPYHFIVVLCTFCYASNTKVIPYIGRSYNNTSSQSMQQDSVLMSRKRRRKGRTPKKYTQMETSYPSNSRVIEGQSVSFPQEWETNRSNLRSVHTCAYNNGQKRRREE